MPLNCLCHPTKDKKYIMSKDDFKVFVSATLPKYLYMQECYVGDVDVHVRF
jgi:hypothetical protein